MRKLPVFLMICLLLSACGPAPKPVKHDVNRAIEEIQPVIKALFFTKDYKSAYERFDPEFRRAYDVDNLEGTVVEMITGYGKLTRLDIDSYSAQENMGFLSLYATGINEKGVTYHRYILKGDADKGYKFYGLHITPGPFPAAADRKKLEKNVTLKK